MKQDYSGDRRERNWKRWFWSYVVHFMQGVVVGALVPWPINLVLAYMGYSQYQTVEYRRLQDLRDSEHEGKAPVGDWPSLDLMDRLAGIWVGILCQLVILIVLLVKWVL